MSKPALVQIRNLRVFFPVRPRLFRSASAWVRAVDDVSFEIASGETVGVAGESGCGKSTLARAVVRLLDPTAGQVVWEGQDITQLAGARLRGLRRRFQMIFQDPYGSLDPRMTVENIIGEALDIHGLASTRMARRQRVMALLNQVGLDPAHASRFPHEFSGGQRQRIGIARALAVEPKLIVCDEPVSALDVSVQAQVVNLLQDLQKQQGLAYLFIAHDLALLEHISQRILVMYLGKVVELGNATAVCRQARHPYTQALLSAVPSISSAPRPARMALSGDVPSPVDPPKGCPFHPRCPIAELRCKTDVPPLREIVPGHWAACHLAR